MLPFRMPRTWIEDAGETQGASTDPSALDPWVATSPADTLRRTALQIARTWHDQTYILTRRHDPILLPEGHHGRVDGKTLAWFYRDALAALEKSQRVSSGNQPEHIERGRSLIMRDVRTRLHETSVGPAWLPSRWTTGYPVAPVAASRFLGAWAAMDLDLPRTRTNRDPSHVIVVEQRFAARAGPSGRGSVGTEARRLSGSEFLEAIATDYTLGLAARGRLATALRDQWCEGACDTLADYVLGAYRCGAIGPERLGVLVRRHGLVGGRRVRDLAEAEAPHGRLHLYLTLLRSRDLLSGFGAEAILGIRKECGDRVKTHEWLHEAAISPEFKVTSLSNRNESLALLLAPPEALDKTTRLAVLKLGPLHPAFLRHDDLVRATREAKARGLPWVNMDPAGDLTGIMERGAVALKHPSRNPALNRLRRADGDWDNSLQIHGGRIFPEEDELLRSRHLLVYGPMIPAVAYRRALAAATPEQRGQLTDLFHMVRTDEKIEAAFGPENGARGSSGESEAPP